MTLLGALVHRPRAGGRGADRDAQRARSSSPEGKPVEGAQIVIEFADGVNRKFEVKSDRRGEFIQIGLPPGNYKVTATVDKLGTVSQNTRVILSTHGRSRVQLRARRRRRRRRGRRPPPKPAALKKSFEEGVVATQAKDFDLAIAEVQRGRGRRAQLLRLLLQHRLRLFAEEGRQAGRSGVAEGRRAETGLHRGAQRAGDALQQPEAVRRSGGDERQGGRHRRRQAAAMPTPSTTRASSCGTRARFPRPR